MFILLSITNLFGPKIEITFFKEFFDCRVVLLQQHFSPWKPNLSSQLTDKQTKARMQKCKSSPFFNSKPTPFFPRERARIHPQVCDLRLMKRNADLTTFVLFLDALGLNILNPFRK